MTDQRLKKLMPLGEHLELLRGRVLLALLGIVAITIICLFFGDCFLRLINWPLQHAAANVGGQAEKSIHLYTHHPAEKILTHMKISLLFGIIFSCPWIFYQLWTFVAEGLYPHERKFVWRVLPFSVGLFLAGCAFFMFIMAPFMLEFLLRFDIGIDAVDQWRLREYVGFILTLTLVFGIGFQLPLFIIALVKMGIVTVGQLAKYRPYVILVLVFIGAVLTPPDVVSQLALAAPMYLLYEMSLLLCRIRRPK